MTFELDQTRRAGDLVDFRREEVRRCARVWRHREEKGDYELRPKHKAFLHSCRLLVPIDEDCLDVSLGVVTELDESARVRPAAGVTPELLGGSCGCLPGTTIGS